MRKEQLKRLYEEYILSGRLDIAEIKFKFSLKNEEVRPAIEKAIEFFGKNNNKI